MKYFKRLSMLCLCMLSAAHLFGQAAVNDSTYLQDNLTQAADNFNRSIGQQSRLYNGTNYLGYARTIKGNALFPLNEETWEAGEVTYDGIRYKNVPMMYDIYKDVLVVLLYNHFSSYYLVSDKVSQFSFSQHRFVRVNADSLVNDKSGISTGFYDQLYGGKSQVLAKRSKNIQNSTNNTALETYFLASNDYYVLKGNTYYKVSSKSSFLNVFKDKKSALQKYLSDNDISFKKDPEAAMATLANYYDHLPN